MTGSFLDYAMPRADDLPSVVSDLVEIPAKTNPLGIKGIGEAGTIGPADSGECGARPGLNISICH
jgi:aerobic carbon-monoxide dehydrogenase large subunit